MAPGSKQKWEALNAQQRAQNEAKTKAKLRIAKNPNFFHKPSLWESARDTAMSWLSPSQDREKRQTSAGYPPSTNSSIDLKNDPTVHVNGTTLRIHPWYERINGTVPNYKLQLTVYEPTPPHNVLSTASPFPIIRGAQFQGFKQLPTPPLVTQFQEMKSKADGTPIPGPITQMNGIFGVPLPFQTSHQLDTAYMPMLKIDCQGVLTYFTNINNEQQSTENANLVPSSHQNPILVFENDSLTIGVKYDNSYNSGSVLQAAIFSVRSSPLFIRLKTAIFSPVGANCAPATLPTAATTSAAPQSNTQNAAAVSDASSAPLKPVATAKPTTQKAQQPTVKTRKPTASATPHVTQTRPASPRGQSTSATYPSRPTTSINGAHSSSFIPNTDAVKSFNATSSSVNVAAASAGSITSALILICVAFLARCLNKKRTAKAGRNAVITERPTAAVENINLEPTNSAHASPAYDDNLSERVSTFKPPTSATQTKANEARFGSSYANEHTYGNTQEVSTV